MAEHIRRLFSRRLSAAWLGLTALFVILAPSASDGLSLAGRIAFWLLHIGVGLAVATAAARWLVLRTNLPRDWRLIALSGAIGVVLFAPLALGLETLFPGTAGAPDSAIEAWGQQSLLHAVIAESIALAPSYLAAWFLINLESITRLWRLTAPRTAPTPVPEAPAEEIVYETQTASLPALPPAIGDDIVAVSSDLHYLQVYTRIGKAMVLGAINDVERALPDAGLRIHRSHWIVKQHVRKLHRRGNGWWIEMDNDLELPVSRRKQAAVRDALGRDFEVTA